METGTIMAITAILCSKYSMEDLKERCQNSQLHQPNLPNQRKLGLLRKHGEIIIMRNKASLY